MDYLFNHYIPDLDLLFIGWVVPYIKGHNIFLRWGNEPAKKFLKAYLGSRKKKWKDKVVVNRVVKWSGFSPKVLRDQAKERLLLDSSLKSQGFKGYKAGQMGTGRIGEAHYWSAAQNRAQTNNAVYLKDWSEHVLPIGARGRNRQGSFLPRVPIATHLDEMKMKYLPFRRKVSSDVLKMNKWRVKKVKSLKGIEKSGGSNYQRAERRRIINRLSSPDDQFLKQVKKWRNSKAGKESLKRIARLRKEEESLLKKPLDRPMDIEKLTKLAIEAFRKKGIM